MKKPSDLLIPFSFENRRPIVIDRFFVVPPAYNNHAEKGVLDFSSQDFFSNDNPVNIEYCSGNGQWILDKAFQNPNINWIAIEMRFTRARQLWVNMHNRGIKNLFVVFGEGHTFTKHYVKKGCISNIFIKHELRYMKSFRKTN
jgi:tRNA (guanine-N7-)-methyltransferase